MTLLENKILYRSLICKTDKYRVALVEVVCVKESKSEEVRREGKREREKRERILVRIARLLGYVQ